jgi:hypothetical protein
MKRFHKLQNFKRPQQGHTWMLSTTLNWFRTNKSHHHGIIVLPETSSRSPLQTTFHRQDCHNKLSPILWGLYTVRRWNTLLGALQKDVSWKAKPNGAFFGGEMTGKFTDSEH